MNLIFLGARAGKTLGLTAMALGLAAVSAHAAMDGTLVNVAPYFGGTSSPYIATPNVTVSSGVEYAAGSFAGYGTSWQVDVNDTQIKITDATSSGFPYVASAFNGWGLTMLSGLTIATATVDGSSQFSPSSITISADGKEVFLNYAGVTGPAGGTSIVDLTFTPVPEPTSAIAGLLCLGPLALGLRRRRKS